MRNRSFLSSKINFYVAMLFVLSFGLTATSMILKVSNLPDPITGSDQISLEDWGMY